MSGNQWRAGSQVEVEIVDLNDTGEGVGRVEGKVLFVPDTAVGDKLLATIVRLKRKYAYGKLKQMVQPSPHRIRPGCIVADKCGGCQWQHIDYHYQQQIKQQQLTSALEYIGGFDKPNVAPIIAGAALHYRNKSTYPLATSATGKVQAGYYRSGTHRLINLNQCPVQDRRLNPLLAGIKADIERQGWFIYDEAKHQGKLRHLSLRIGRRTGEILLTLVTTDWQLPGIQQQAQQWLQRYEGLVGVCLNLNPSRTNVIFGNQTRLVAGKDTITEIFADLKLQLRSETFFQINTEVAESLLEVIVKQLNLTGSETLIDAYSGVGTFTLPLAKYVKQVVGVEVVAASVAQAKENAQLNQIDNVVFHTGKVEHILPQLDVKADVIILDPPRTGCDRAVIETLLQMQPSQIVYISCKPATLARDLKLLCKDIYQLNLVQPADFFPQTVHTEAAAFLSLAKI